MAETHDHDWHELGRAFYLTDADTDLETLSPHGLHDPDTGELASATEIIRKGGKLAAAFRDKVPAPVPVVILQCQDPDCPKGPKHIEHVKLTKDEQQKIREAFEAGRLDPDGNGTNRLLSTASLRDLGLGRIEEMLGEGRRSGTSDAVIG